MPSLSSTEGGKYPTMIPAGHFEHPNSISYIDLDLPPAGDNDHDAADESAASDTGYVKLILTWLFTYLFIRDIITVNLRLVSVPQLLEKFVAERTARANVY